MMAALRRQKNTTRSRAPPNGASSSTVKYHPPPPCPHENARPDDPFCTQSEPLRPSLARGAAASTNPASLRSALLFPTALLCRSLPLIVHLVQACGPCIRQDLNRRHSNPSLPALHCCSTPRAFPSPSGGSKFAHTTRFVCRREAAYPGTKPSRLANLSAQ